jgi:hypothetical protein
MVKSSILIVLMGALLAMTFSNAIILTRFYANRTFIARNLCENRNRPAMKCGGRCCLLKKLKQENKDDQQGPERRSESGFELIFQQRDNDINHPLPLVVRIKYMNFQEPVYNRFTTGVFHPPQC